MSVHTRLGGWGCACVGVPAAARAAAPRSICIQTSKAKQKRNANTKDQRSSIVTNFSFSLVFCCALVVGGPVVESISNRTPRLLPPFPLPIQTRPPAPRAPCCSASCPAPKDTRQKKRKQRRRDRERACRSAVRRGRGAVSPRPPVRPPFLVPLLLFLRSISPQPPHGPRYRYKLAGGGRAAHIHQASTPPQHKITRINSSTTGGDETGSSFALRPGRDRAADSKTCSAPLGKRPPVLGPGPPSVTRRTHQLVSVSAPSPVSSFSPLSQFPSPPFSLFIKSLLSQTLLYSLQTSKRAGQTRRGTRHP